MCKSQIGTPAAWMGQPVRISDDPDLSESNSFEEMEKPRPRPRPPKPPGCQWCGQTSCLAGTRPACQTSRDVAKLRQQEAREKREADARRSLMETI